MRFGASPGRPARPLHPRAGAGGYLLPENPQIIKTNGVGTMDLVWSRTFAVRSNGDYILRLPYRTEDASLANLLLLRYTLGTNDSPKLDLPTDAEWSVAVGLGPEQGRTPEDRLQGSVAWPWGCNWPPHDGDGNYAPELETDKFLNTSPVGSFKPNRHGLFDLGGNAWEWCDDWYSDARVTKVLRGGSFHDSQPKDLLAAYRFSGTVHLNNDDIGFRVVIEDASAPHP